MEAESRFDSLNAQDFEALVADKDSENTKKSTKVAVELFWRYLAGTTICCTRSYHFPSSRRIKLL